MSPKKKSAPAYFISLYIDEDVTTALAPALRQRGFRAQSTLEAGNIGLSDEDQLRYAAEHGMAILTSNARDFVLLAQAWFWAGKEHAGIIITKQFTYREFGALLRQTLKLLNTLSAEEMRNQVIFLQTFVESVESEGK